MAREAEALTTDNVVLVCKHVLDGERPELVLDPGLVEFAFCRACYEIVNPLVEAGNDLEASKFIFPVHRDCAADLGVPRFVAAE